MTDKSQITKNRAEFWCPLSPTGTVDTNTRAASPDIVWGLMSAYNSGYVKRSARQFYADGFRVIRVQIIEVECADAPA